MDWIAGPAALGGMMLCVALGAWSLGRWQGASALARVPRAGRADRAAGALPAPGASLPAAASPAPGLVPGPAPGRTRNAGPTDRLGQIHAEISAYRRTERVLAELDRDALPPRGANDLRSREFPIMGQPACGSGVADCIACKRVTCSTETAAPALAEIRAVQPSAAGDGARV